MSVKLKLKVEKWGHPFILAEIKDKKKKGEGGKKRWSMRVRYQDGIKVDYIVIKGFEYVRRDSSVLCKCAQKATLDLMMKGEISEKERKLLKLEDGQGDDVISLIRTVKKNCESGVYDIDTLAIPKRPGMKWKAYNPRPAFVRGVFYFNEHISSGGKVKFIEDGEPIKHIYVKRVPGYAVTDVISYEEVNSLPPLTVDYDTMFKKQVWAKVEKLLKLMGYNWNHIIGQTTIGEFL